MMTAAVAPNSAAPRGAVHAGTRERWHMGVEARALLLVTAVLVSFGLVVLYSASSIVAVSQGKSGSMFLTRQATGAVLGIVVFALAAKVDADWWRRLAWPIMGISLLLMLVTVLPFTSSLVSSLHGSRR